MINLENNYQVRKLEEKDIPEVVKLFNKNKVYQFRDREPLSVSDFIKTMKIKEVSHFYVLEKFGEIIGTTAFFKFVTFGSTKDCYTYSGYLLIDSAHRNGTATRFFQKEISKDIANRDFRLCFTEISRYNKASLSLSKHNGFSLFKESYEDIDHSYLLWSMLPKVYNALNIGERGLDDNSLDQYKIVEHKDIGDFTKLTMHNSGEDFIFKAFPRGKYPFYFKSSLIKIFIFEKNNHYFLNCEFYSDEVLRVEKKSDKKNTEILSRDKPILKLSQEGAEALCTVDIITSKGTNSINLHYINTEKKSKFYLLKQKIFSYPMKVNLQDGSLYIYNDHRIIIEDVFPQFSKPSDTKFYVEEHLGKVIIRCIGTGIDIKKILLLTNYKIHGHYIFDNTSFKRQYCAKNGLKFWTQNYFIESETGYTQYMPGVYPDELDYFVKSSEFTKNDFNYIFPEESIKVNYISSNLGSNQMYFRPLIPLEMDSGDENITYEIHFSKLNDNLLNLNIKNEDFLEDGSFSWNLVKDIRCYTKKIVNSSVRYNICDEEVDLNYNIDKNNNKILLTDITDNDLEYVMFELKYFCASKIQISKYGTLYTYQNKGPVWEVGDELFIFEESNNKYTSFKIPKGNIYSFKENNKLIVRCVVSINKLIIPHVQISQFIGG